MQFCSIRFTAKISLSAQLFSPLLSLSYTERSIGNFLFNSSQYYVHERTRFFNLYRHEPLWIVSYDGGADGTKV
jgi:hypothetical protein